MHRCIGSDFRFLISLPTSGRLLTSAHPVDNVGDQPVMMSSHFLQAKPSPTTLSPSVTVSADVARRIPYSSVLHQKEEVGTNLGGRNMTPPGVSHLGHFVTVPCGTTLAAYSRPAGFGMRLLYAYGNAQVGFSPFET
jgi:hypothetical protein